MQEAKRLCNFVVALLENTMFRADWLFVWSLIMVGLVAVLLVCMSVSICKSATLISQQEGVNVLWKDQEVCS